MILEKERRLHQEDHMKVAVFHWPKHIEIEERLKPEVQSGEVLVKVEYSGICGTDVHGYLSGVQFPTGTIIGHEFSGTVAEIGEDVKGLKLDDRVAIKPFAQCGECYWCRKGQYSLCAQFSKRAMGFSVESPGALAEYVLIRYPEEMIYPLSPNVPHVEAALAEPLATSLHAIRLSRFRPGDMVVISGGGMIGLSILQFLKLEKAGKVIVIEISQAKTRIAEELGADLILDPASGKEEITRRIFQETNGIGADLVFESAGVPLSFQHCLDYVKKGGQVMVVGSSEKETPIISRHLVLREVELKASLTYYDEFKEVLQYLEQRSLKPHLFISDVIPLENIEERGFKRLSASHDFVKILVKPTD